MTTNQRELFPATNYDSLRSRFKAYQHELDRIVSGKLGYKNEEAPPSYMIPSTHVKLLTFTNSALESLLADPTSKQYLDVWVVKQRSGVSKYSNWRTMLRTFEQRRAEYVADWYKQKASHLEVKIVKEVLIITADTGRGQRPRS